MPDRPLVIDCLLYRTCPEEIFRQMQAGGGGAVHATVCSHETFREMAANVEARNRPSSDFESCSILQAGPHRENLG